MDFSSDRLESQTGSSLSMSKSSAAASAIEDLSSDESDVAVEVARAKSHADYYDNDVDDKDEAWSLSQRQGRKSDAILSCPACFTSLCIDCQRHDKYVHQYRAMFVRNCRVVKDETLRLPANPDGRKKQKRRKNKRIPVNTDGSGACVSTEERKSISKDDELFNPVHCSVCDTEVALLDKDEVYHFFHVMPSYA